MPDGDEAQADLKLIRTAVGGDRRAARLIVTRLAPSVQRGVTHVLMQRRSTQAHRRQEMEDLVQETFVSLFAHGGRELLRWDPTRGMKLESFVALLTRRLVIAKLRVRPLEALQLGPPEVPENVPTLSSSADVVFAAREDLHALSEYLGEALSHLGLAMFHRLFVLEQTVEVICRETGMTVDAVYQWRKRLRNTIQEIRAQITVPVASERGAQ